MKAVKKQNLLLFFSLLLLFGGCDNEHSSPSSESEKEFLPISLSVATTTEMRALNTSTSFMERSHIGIYILSDIVGETPDSMRFITNLIGNYANVGYTLIGTTWVPNPTPPQPTIIVPNPSKKISFDYYAYYPFSGDSIPSPITSLSNLTAIPFSLPINQTLDTSLDQSDLMTAQHSTYNNVVTLLFQRQCVLLQFVFKRGINWEPADETVVRKISIGGKQLYYEGKMDIRGINKITALSEAVKGKTIYRLCDILVPPDKFSTNSDYLIIPPTASGANNTDLLLSFTILYQGTEYTYQFPLPSRTYLSGKHYTYQVTLNSPTNPISKIVIDTDVALWTKRSWSTSFN